MNILENINNYIKNNCVYANKHKHNENIIVLNYSPRCIYEGVWDDITSICRGLIIDTSTGEILARPFDKFFNYNEPGVMIPKGRPEVTVKLDGSLGISYCLDNKIYWATRGSFISEQSQAAQKMWDEKYSHVSVPKNLTLLTEIIHPTSRNVVKYDYEDLMLIGARDRFTGHDFNYFELSTLSQELKLPIVEKVDFSDLNSVIDIAKSLDSQHEGFVLRWPDGYRVKVKSDQYLEAHRIIHGLSTQKIVNAWEFGKIEEIIFALPEEFHSEVEKTKNDLDSLFEKEVNDFHYVVLAQISNFASRKEYALWVQKDVPVHFQAAAFACYDGRSEKYLSILKKRICTNYCKTDICESEPTVDKVCAKSW